MTVSELEDRMEAREFLEWMALEDVRAEQRLAGSMAQDAAQRLARRRRRKR